MTWETKEVIDTLINDEGSYKALRRAAPSEVQQIVLSGCAPSWLYQSFKRFNGSFDRVDWNEVARHL